MLNFTSVLLLSATSIYIFQDDFKTFLTFSIIAILGRLASYSIENSEKIGEKNVKKERKILQEHVH